MITDVADFPGLYGVAEPGAKAGKGDFVMNNDKGVALQLKAGAKGLAPDLSVQGLKITME